MSGGGERIEVVLGQLDDARRDSILRFWQRSDALEASVAQRRLEQVLCVLLDKNGDVAGVNSAFEDRVALLGNRRFWIYRMFLLPRIERRWAAAMAAAAYNELNRRFAQGGPIGLCLMLKDPSIFPGHRGAFWSDLGMLYAGYLRDGRQIRIRYFDGARI